MVNLVFASKKHKLKGITFYTSHVINCKCKLSFILGYTWKNLGTVVKDEGNLLHLHLGQTQQQNCEELCDKNINCNSFGYCPGSSECYLYDKILYGTEPLTTRHDCTSSFRFWKGDYNTSQTT